MHSFQKVKETLSLRKTKICSSYIVGLGLVWIKWSIAPDKRYTDSEAEGALGSVSKLVVRPPGHSGKAKRGHLCFDAAFEAGNLGRVDYIAEYEYDVFIRPDTCNPRYRASLNFCVDNAKQGQFAIFNVVNLHKSETLFAAGMTPLVRSTSRPKWTRLPREQVYYFNSPDHGGHHILSFCFCFDIEEDSYQFSLTYPYSYTRMQAYLNRLEANMPSFCRRSNLANSVLKRRCDLLTITAPRLMTAAVADAGAGAAPEDIGKDGSGSGAEDDFQAQQEKRVGKTAVEVLGKVPRGIIGVAGTPEEEKRTPESNSPSSPKSPAAEGDHEAGAQSDGQQLQLQHAAVLEKLASCSQETEGSISRSYSDAGENPFSAELPRAVVVMARAHAGDSPTSYIVQGMVEQLLSLSDVSTTLRNHVIFKIIPMMNPDGVYLGNYRTTLLGASLNRQWGLASPWGHPSLHAARSLILLLDRVKWCELDLVLDLHSHMTLLGTFLYGTAYDDVYRHERHIVFPKILSFATEDYAHENTIYNKDPALAHTSRRWLANNLSNNVNSYSVHTSMFAYTDRSGEVVPYTEDAYIRVGRNLVRAILDYYQFLGIIPHDLPDALPLHDLPKHKPDAPVRRKNKSSTKRKSRSRRTAARAKAKISASSDGAEIISQFLSNSQDDPSAVATDTPRQEVCGSDSGRRARSRGDDSDFGSPSCDRSASNSSSSRSSKATSQEEDDGSATTSSSSSLSSVSRQTSNSNNGHHTSRSESSSRSRSSSGSSSRSSSSFEGNLSDGSKLAVLIGPGLKTTSKKKKGSLRTNSPKTSKLTRKTERPINFAEYARKKVPHHVYMFPEDISGYEPSGPSDYPALKGAKPKLSQVTKRISRKPKHRPPAGTLKDSGNLSEAVAFSYFDWCQMTRAQRRERRKHRKRTSKSKNFKRKSRRKSSKNSSPSKKFPIVVSKPRNMGYISTHPRRRNTQRNVVNSDDNQDVRRSQGEINPSSDGKIRTIVFGPELDGDRSQTCGVTGWHATAVKTKKSPPSNFKTIAKAPTLLQYFLNPKGGIL